MMDFVVFFTLLAGVDCWWSLSFIIPQPLSESGRNCSILKKNFCLRGYFTDSPIATEPFLQTYYSPSPKLNLFRAQEEFMSLIYPIFQTINFFSFSTKRFGHCCDYQRSIYTIYGYGNGHSPINYIKKLTDFSTKNRKHLTFIRANFEPSICLNVILEIGFGSGSLKIDGKVSKDIQFVFPIQYERETVIYSNSQLTSGSLNFRMWKRQFVCPDNPWLCLEQSERPSEQIAGLLNEQKLI
ncbi:uncharacterized protein LOC134848527 [Symsagittifera roscoffensis]|uniref:uncharacterized protein LOC134848527 n=1 Tax=Symsagittifera roscoffensis TaxID=84072 RepID=UPI00307C933C